MGDMNFPDPNTTTEHDGWDWDSEKWTKWGSGGGSSKPEGYDDAKAIASGAMTTGEMVVLNDDGTVSVVAQTVTIGEELEEGTGPYKVFDSGAATESIDSVYDPVSSKVVVVYSGGPNRYCTAVVGTVVDTTITFGTPVVFDSSGFSIYMRVTYDTLANRVVIAFAKANAAGYATVGEVSDDTITFGTAVRFDGVTVTDIDIEYDPVNNKSVIVYCVASPYVGQAIVGTVNDKTISFGSKVQFSDEVARRPRIIYDPDAQKMIVAYVRGNDQKGNVVLGTVAEATSSISFGSPEIFCDTKMQADEGIATVYDPDSKKTFIAYDVGRTSGSAVLVTVTGDTISLGTPVSFESSGACQWMSVCYDSGLKKFVITYQLAYANGWLVSASLSGDDIVFDSPKEFQSSQVNRTCITYDPVNLTPVIAFDDYPNNQQIAMTYSSGGKSPDITETNLTADNFIGVSKGSYFNGSEATVQIAGINADQQGMTVGKQYIQPDGSLDTTEGTPSVLAGTAISSTELNIKDTV